jgi:quinol monooxygenase YgiN
MIFIVVKQPVRPEYADQWLSLVEPFTSATRAEPGNIFFDWFRSTDDPNLYLLVEGFRDAEAGKVHVDSPHFKAAMEQLPHWLADVPEIINVEVVGHNWARMSELQVDGTG